MHPDDTIVALSSARGSSERAIVRVSGSGTRRVVTSVFGDFNLHRNQLIPGNLRLSGVHSPLPATLYFFAAPRSYTGQDLAELHTIGSPPLVERLLADLLAAGTRPAGPGEFTQRAFLAGKLDLTRAEAVQAVIESRGDEDLKTALAQLAGNIARPLDALRNDLLNLLADVEAALDFVDEDIEFVSRTDTLNRVAAALAQLQNLRRQLESRTVSGTLVRVAIVGKPNAGKSSLFNALAGSSKSIVSPIPGTTRDYLITTIELAGSHVELIDTAGLDNAVDPHDADAQRLGRAQALQADIMLWCAESSHETFDMPRHENILRVGTKCDLAASREDLATSSVTGEGLTTLRHALSQRVASLVKSPLAPSQSRCRHHVNTAIDCLRRAHGHSLNEDPAELLALELRLALDQLGEMVGAIYSNDLLDRIFSRFCIGK